MIVASPADIPALATITPEVQDGLKRAQERMDCARDNEEYYQGRNEAYIQRREGEDDQSFHRRPKRVSLLTRVAIRKLGEGLYKTGPTRTLEGGGAVDTWLQAVYADTHIDHRLQSADRAATLNHVAAIQVEASGDPEQPIRLWLWKAHEFEVFCPGNDPLTPWAICTKEVIDWQKEKRIRYRVWSAYERYTFLTKPYRNDLAGGRVASEIVGDESGPTPYPGVLPFVFIRNEPPESTFWEGGIGTPLRMANAEIDRELTDLSEHVAKFLNPKGYVRNVPAGTRFFESAGNFTHLPSMPAAMEGDTTAQPDVFYLQPTLNVEQAWLNIRNYADATLEELELPLTAVRSDASTDLSGVAIYLKAEPFADRTRARQSLYSEFESELASTILAVGGIWYGRGDLLAAAQDPKLILSWPEPRIAVRTVEQDASDEWELERGLKSPIEVLAQRRGITIDQAIELAQTIAEQTKAWNAMREAMGVVPEPEGEDDDSEGEGEGEGDEQDSEGD